MTCPLCGYKIKEYAVVCQSCMIHNNCKLICCPNCHYQFPQESRLINWLQSLSKRKHKNDPASD